MERWMEASHHQRIWFSSISIYLVGTEQATGYCLSSPSDTGRNFSHLIKSKAFSVGGDAWVCWKALQHFLLSFMACDKNWLFLIFYEKCQMSSCTSCLIRHSDTSISLTMDLIDLLGLLSIIACILFTNLGSSFLSKQSNASWIFQLFESSALSSGWHSNTLKSSHLGFQS